MNLYHWDRVEVLENYAVGDLIVMAESVEEARALGRVALLVQVKQVWDYAWEAEGTPEDDSDWQKIRADKLALIEKDLAADPKIVEGRAVAVRGSE